jgi:hypothetical protein
MFSPDCLSAKETKPTNKPTSAIAYCFLSRCFPPPAIPFAQANPDEPVIWHLQTLLPFTPMFLITQANLESFVWNHNFAHFTQAQTGQQS